MSIIFLNSFTQVEEFYFLGFKRIMTATATTATNPAPPARMTMLFIKELFFDVIDILTFLLPAWADELTASSIHSSLLMRISSPSSSEYLITAVEGSKLGIFLPTVWLQSLLSFLRESQRFGQNHRQSCRPRDLQIPLIESPLIQLC